MKKLFTLFCLIALVCGANAQTNYRALNGLSALKSAPPIIKKGIGHSTSRAASTPILLDYDGLDDKYSSDNSFTYTRYRWDLNSHFSNADFSLAYATQFYDTIEYLDSTGAITFIPRSATTITVDSFDAYFIHTNMSSTKDTLHYILYDKSAAVTTGYGTPTATFTTPPLWDSVIITDQGLSTDANTLTVLTFYPNISLPQGHSFGVRVNYAGDTSDHFEVLMGFRNQCGSCNAEFSKAGNNTGYYLNLTQDGPPVSNFSGYYENLHGGQQIFYDCDNSGGYTVGGCENFVIQNWVNPVYITASANFGAVVTADSLKGCPGTALNLSAVGYGSNATPYTYNWASNTGTLTSTGDQQVGFVLGTTNATVTVTVTDANGDSTIATTHVTSKGITINISGANPLVIPCGSGNNTIITTVGGQSTAGKVYNWSTGSTTSTIVVSTPGNYSVTVTNNSGCTATASLSVQYQNGITNNVGFTVPPAPLCQGRELTFHNTTTQTSGWNPTWDFGDTHTNFNLDGVNTYGQQGVFPVTLTMDSANCTFSHTASINVLAATNNACVSGIEDVTFANAISMLPNPTNGNVSITINGVEKNLSIRVYNIIGSEVKAFGANDIGSTFSKAFDFSDLPGGTYLVKIQTADKTAVKRLTVSK